LHNNTIYIVSYVLI